MYTPCDVFKSLSDETRARATLLIAHQGELCVCELMCALDDSQPKVSGFITVSIRIFPSGFARF